MEKIAFKGDGTTETGRKIIETLEKMGGINASRLNGLSSGCIYWNNEGTSKIRCNLNPPNDYRILTIEQYEAEQAQKEPLDLTKILECCEGVELWCTVLGKVKLISINKTDNYPIIIGSESKDKVTKDGRWLETHGECVLFPSFDNRDWSTFKKPAKVIFTNCVGEVFTEEDENNDIIVWYYEDVYSNQIYACKISSLVRCTYKASSISSDIFRSKKSLLKYLYETCE